MTFKTRLAWRTRPLRAGGRLACWLHDRGSLTARLQARGRFAVRLLRQGPARPTRDEAAALEIKRDRLLWVREVALCVDPHPLVFAHTILPNRPRGPLRVWLARLGRQSLGALLFSRPRFVRSAIACKRLDRRHPLYAPAIAALQLADSPPAMLWARRSRFVHGAQSVLVTEVFAPALADD